MAACAGSRCVFTSVSSLTRPSVLTLREAALTLFLSLTLPYSKTRQLAS